MAETGATRRWMPIEPHFWPAWRSRLRVSGLAKGPIEQPGMTEAAP